MLDFLVLGFPRSGTTWLANWLTTEHSLCFHEPFTYSTIEDVLAYHHPMKRVGVADTGLWYRPDICVEIARRIAVIHRPRSAINHSLTQIGMPEIDFDEAHLWALPGLHFQFEQIFDTDEAERLHDHLLPGMAYDRERHALLKEMIVNPNLETVRMDATKARAFLARVFGGVPCQ